MTASVRLVSVASELPATVRTSAEVEQLVARSSDGFTPRPGVVEALTGIRERRVAADDVQCSDLAVAACRRVLDQTGASIDEIDLLIFASAGQDLIEPATSHIVQAKLGTNCPVFDVKNACNSFLNGIQLAESLIAGGTHKNVLVAVGEINSRAADWSVRDLREFKRNLPGYTMGDAGAAALLSAATNGRGIFLRRFYAASQHWGLTTVSSGGSMHPRGDEHTYLRADVSGLRQVFRTVCLPFLQRALHDARLDYKDFQRIFVHQVSLPYLEDTLEVSGITQDMVELTVASLGNMAAASIPVAIAQAVERGCVGPGDRILCIGLASGISFGIMMIDL